MKISKNELQRTKVLGYIISVIFIFIVMIIAIFAIVYHYENNQNEIYTSERWFSEPEERINMVQDMLSKNDFIGNSDKEITEILGDPDYKDNLSTGYTRWVYYLGSKSNHFETYSSSLVIVFYENTVIDIKTEVDG